MQLNPMTEMALKYFPSWQNHDVVLADLTKNAEEHALSTESEAYPMKTDMQELAWDWVLICILDVLLK